MPIRNFPYRLAAIDLDDTLLSPDKTISVENAAAVRSLQDLGVMILLASGRRHENMLKYHNFLELDSPIVSCQGAYARETKTDETLFRQCMPASLSAEIVAEGIARGVTQIYYHVNGTYVTETNEWTELYGRRTGTPVTMVPSLRKFDSEQPLKLLWVDSPENIEALFAEMTAKYTGLLEIVVTDPEYLEYMAIGVTKSLGVAAVANKYGIEQSEILAFGDGNNDVTMLQWAGLGVAMDHARPAAKQAADLVAPEGAAGSSFARGVEMVLNRSTS